MSDKQVIISVFDSETSADNAVGSLKAWDKVSADIKLNAVGVLVLDEKGNLKAHKLGRRSGGKGASIGFLLALLTPVGLVGGIVGGGILGHLHHKGLGLSEADRDRISADLKDGKAAVGVLAPADEGAAISKYLADLGGKSETHPVTDEALEEAAKSETAQPAAPSTTAG
jgi:hypothetical protein